MNGPEPDQELSERKRRLLERWFRRVRESQFQHYAAERYFSCLNYSLGIPAVVLSAVVGTSIFVSLSESVNGQIGSIWWVIVGLISVLAAGLSALHTFLHLGERAKAHQQAAANYAAVRREIEQLYACHRDSIEDKVLDNINAQLDTLALESPNVPNWAWKTANKRIKEDPASLSEYFDKEQSAEHKHK